MKRHLGICGFWVLVFLLCCSQVSAAEVPGTPKESDDKDDEWDSQIFLSSDGRKIVSLQVTNRVESLPQITLFLRYPPGIEPGGKVEGVMASVTHMQQPKSVSDFIKRPVESDGRFAFAERNKLAILSWTTNTVYSASQSFTETPREAENPNDNMEKSFRAWSKGIKRMGKEYGMPQHDFLIYGYSRGAQWSHRLAIRDPKRFAAVHIHVNSSFAEPSKEASGCLWLVTTGELEYGAPAAREFYMKGLAMDFPIMLRIYPNLGHATSNQEARLGIRFFEYALSRLKDKNAQITALEGDAFAKPKLKELASFHRATLEGFVKPSFYGDAVNGDVVPVEKAKMIPEADRIPLPDKAIAEVWGYYPGL